MPSPIQSDPSPPSLSPVEVEHLVAEFRAGTWPLAKWTHRAHLVVALWHLRHYPLAEATQLIREGIQRYNRAQGIPTTPTRGYHETLTLFWIWAVNRYLAGAPPKAALAELADDLLRSPSGDNNNPF
jgi:hypothetical protein